MELVALHALLIVKNALIKILAKLATLDIISLALILACNAIMVNIMMQQAKLVQIVQLHAALAVHLLLAVLAILAIIKMEINVINA